MPEKTTQLKEWKTIFGKEYTDRNAISLNDLELVKEKQVKHLDNENVDCF